MGLEPQEGFEFLGFRIDPKGAEIQQKRADRVEQIMLLEVKALGLPDATLAQRTEALIRINAVIRGFRNYFLISDEPKIWRQLQWLDTRMEEMAGFHLPVEIRKDPAWICRERFSPEKLNHATHPESSAAILAKTGLAYPKSMVPLLPAQWIMEDDILEASLKTQVDDPPPVQELSHSQQVPEEEKNEKESLLMVQNGLYVLTHGAYLTLHGNDLVVKKKKESIGRYCFHDLEFIFVQGFGITISVTLQLKLTDLDIPLIIAAPAGTPIAVMNPVASSKANLRIHQALRRNDPDMVSSGLDMIAAKVGNQAAVLRYFAKYRKKSDSRLCEKLTATATEMREIASHIRLMDPTDAAVRSMAMGAEGKAAALYWGRIADLLPQSAVFPGRRGHNAKDPFNQCLNYVYALLYSEVWRAIVRAGLDPYLGCGNDSCIILQT